VTAAAFEGGVDRQFEPSAPVNEANDEGSEMDYTDELLAEVEAFEYTEELVAIMNMGFSDLGQIKRLLNEHGGNKQNVVQELVSVK